MKPLTENAQKYLLVFIHLGLITSCPGWVLVFPGIMGHLHNCLEMRRNSLDALLSLTILVFLKIPRGLIFLVQTLRLRLWPCFAPRWTKIKLSHKLIWFSFVYELFNFDLFWTHLNTDDILSSSTKMAGSQWKSDIKYFLHPYFFIYIFSKQIVSFSSKKNTCTLKMSISS